MFEKIKILWNIKREPGCVLCSQSGDKDSIILKNLYMEGYFATNITPTPIVADGKEEWHECFLTLKGENIINPFSWLWKGIVLVGGISGIINIVQMFVN